MTQTLVHSLDTLQAWRRTLRQQLATLAALLDENGLLGEGGRGALRVLEGRLEADRLVLACVAEVSRGKSELLNAIFFADAGRRMLPATPGRTTMCPVELQFHADQAPELALLPIDTRADGSSLAELRRKPSAWQRLALDPRHPDSVAEALKLVTQTRRVDTQRAEALGLWTAADSDHAPPQIDGSIEVPAWRHAMINYPHPLLQKGLVVVDTPGLNAVGAEPELTLGLLPSAHAVVFVLGADTGVSRSDLEIWTQHLDAGAVERFVVLNKTDILDDPLSTPEAVRRQLEQQLAEIAHTLQVPPDRVFALSARDALAARISGDAAALARSGLPAFEAALAERLLPRERELLSRAVRSALASLREQAMRRLAQRRRENAEQLLELRGLRGKSEARVRALLERLDVEVGDFERCTARVAAVRAVQQRMRRQAQAALAAEGLRAQVDAMRRAIDAMPLKLGAGRAFREAFGGLRVTLGAAREQVDEMQRMLEASFRQLNAEFGFAFAIGERLALDRFVGELALIEGSYGRYVAPAQAWRLTRKAFLDSFQRMLLSKLRVVFENAEAEIELWSRSAAAQVEGQLTEKRRTYAHRREALQRVLQAAGELEQRIAEVEQQERQLAGLQARLDATLDAIQAQAAEAPPAPATGAEPAIRLRQAS